MNYKKQTKIEYNKKINTALIYIQKNLGSTLTLDKLSEVTYISKFHFHKIFNAVTGENVLQYIKRIRLENAAFRLHYSSETITDIALENGYSTVSAFTKPFRGFFNCSPREYRQNGANIYRIKKQKIGPTRPVSDIARKCKIRNIREQNVLFVRKTGEYALAAQSAWETLFEIIGKSRIVLNNTNLHIGITYDSPDITDAGNLRYDACITIDSSTINIQKNLAVTTQHISGGKFAVFTHTGDCESLWNTYGLIYSDWLLNSKYTLANAPTYAVYPQWPNLDKNIEIFIPIN